MDRRKGRSGTELVADIEETLRSLYQSGINGPGVQENLVKSFQVPEKNYQPLHGSFVLERPKSASFRTDSPDAEDPAYRSGGGVAPEAGTERSGMSSNLRSSSTPGAEEHHPVHSHNQSESSEIQNVGDSKMIMSEGSQSYGFSDSQLITYFEDNENLMQLKLEAMTWAAMAKDFTISSLEKRLRKALHIAKAEQAKNLELHTALVQSRQELSRARENIVRLEEFEERLAREHRESELDATNFAEERNRLLAEQERKHRSQLLMLEHRIRLILGEKAGKGPQYQYLDRSTSQDSNGRWQESDAKILEQELERAQERERSLTEKFTEAAEEIEELKHDLIDANTDIRVSEVLRKTQSRRLKVLEKERRHLLRKGAFRTVTLAPRTQRSVEPPVPGGTGWNVFSVLEFAETEST